MLEYRSTSKRILANPSTIFVSPPVFRTDYNHKKVPLWQIRLDSPRAQRVRSLIPEPRGQEGQVAGSRRRKVGLETPLVGRFWGENRRLLFAPPVWYDSLVLVCILGAAAWVGFRLATGGGLNLVALAVGLAGVWAALSSERMTIDLKARTYVRREGQGVFKRIRRGSVNAIDAVVLTTEVYPVGVIGGQLVIYRLLLYWKGAAEPVFVAERQESTISSGAPLNQNAGGMLQRGERYAKAMAIPFYDNSYYASPPPIQAT